MRKSNTVTTDKNLLNGFALASRLSYFLWSSMPDDELFNLAANGKLQDKEVLAAQVKRMLKDSRARALSDNFAGTVAAIAQSERRQPGHAALPGLQRSSAPVHENRNGTILQFDCGRRPQCSGIS